MDNENKKLTMEDIKEAVNSAPYMNVSLSDWRPTLANEVQVYVLGEQYLAKRFDQINYKFVDKNEAKEIVIDNLYAILRSKYFTKSTEETDDKIQKIVSNFTLNLKTTLKKVSFKQDDDCDRISWLPNSCIAFRNGVFDFKKNKWLFKYDIIKMKNINNKVYMYDPKWLITWYLDYNFEPLDININDVSIEQFIEVMKVMTKQKENYCFELVYNMSHDENDKFDMKKFKYLCQMIGYMLYPGFLEYFGILVGGGSNGKNSLFDGCLSAHVVPSIASNPMEDFENDRFITGSLLNKAQNIYLETTPKTMEISRGLKNITGSMYQTIEIKGVSKFSGILNCKYMFSANDQDRLKFFDNTRGLHRRIQILEIFYEWSEDKLYLKKNPDYYDTSFSQDLHEVKEDVMNSIIFCYLGMYGIMEATKNWVSDFKFGYNDWNQTYTELDLDVKEAVEAITLAKVVNWMKVNKRSESVKTFMYDRHGTNLYLSKIYADTGFDKSIDGLIKMLEDDEVSSSFFAENNICVNLKSLAILSGTLKTQIGFTQAIKKIYNLQSRDVKRFYNNQSYVEVRVINNKLKIVRAS